MESRLLERFKEGLCMVNYFIWNVVNVGKFVFFILKMKRKNW